MAYGLHPRYDNGTSPIDGSSSSSSGGSSNDTSSSYHRHHGSHYVSTTGILVGLLLPHAVCTVVVVARAWSRLVLLRRWFWEDTLIALAWLVSTGVCVVYSIASLTPNIRHAVIWASVVSVEEGRTSSAGAFATERESISGHDSATVAAYMLRTYLGLILYQLCLCLTKLSVLALYLRMFAADTRPRERRLAWLTLVAVVAYGLPLLAISILQCHPGPGLFFDRPVGVCFAFRPLLIASASLHTATDAWLILLVLPCISRLGLPPRQRMALVFVLSLGVFVIAASLTRLQLSLHAHYRPASGGGDTSNHSGSSRTQVANTLGFFVMTILECDMAIICASAPMLRPLLARAVPRLGLGDPTSRLSTRLQRHRQSYRIHRNRHGHGGRDQEDNSVNLTSVVSYHGYPWTRAHTTPLPRSRQSSTGSHKHDSNGQQPGSLLRHIRSETTAASSRPFSEGSTAFASAAGEASSSCVNVSQPPATDAKVLRSILPVPPIPVETIPPASTVHRTPTTLSLRSFVSGMAPRSRTGSGHSNKYSLQQQQQGGDRGGMAEDQDGLLTLDLGLQPDHEDENDADDEVAHTPSSPSGILTRRPSSNLLDDEDYQQYLDLASQEAEDLERQNQQLSSEKSLEGMPGGGVGLGIILQDEDNKDSANRQRWTGSQESLVMGLNDPASPTRLTPLSGLSGETCTDGGHQDKGASPEPSQGTVQKMCS